MELGHLLQKHRVITIATCVVCLLVAGYVVFHASAHAPLQGVTEAYYTDDNGATWFGDRKDLITPLTRGGKEVDRIHLIDVHGKTVPLYLERYLPAAKAKLEQAKAAGSVAMLPPIGQSEVRAISGGDWVPKESTEGMKITTVPSTDDPDAHEIFP